MYKHYASFLRLLPPPYSAKADFLSHGACVPLPWKQVMQMSFFFRIFPERSLVRYPFPSFIFPWKPSTPLLFCSKGTQHRRTSSSDGAGQADPRGHAVWGTRELSGSLIFVKSFKSLLEPKRRCAATVRFWLEGAARWVLLQYVAVAQVCVCRVTTVPAEKNPAKQFPRRTVFS